MSNLNVLLDQLRRAHAAVGEMQEAIAKFPSDRYAQSNLDVMRKEAQALEAEWEEECRSQDVEVCRYRIIPESGTRYAIRYVTKSLLDFQELISQIFDALKGGAKQRAKISGETEAETAFDFGFSYAGSLGVALMVPSGSDLFAGKFDSTVDQFLDIFNISQEDEIRAVAADLGSAVVRKVYDWSKVNVQAGYGIDVTWNTSAGHKKGALIDVESMERIVEVISRTTDEETRQFSTPGTLMGIDGVRRTFRFIAFDSNEYTGRLSDTFPNRQEWAINHTYVANIFAKSVTEYATEEVKETFVLMELQSKSIDDLL